MNAVGDGGEKALSHWQVNGDRDEKIEALLRKLGAELPSDCDPEAG